MIRAINYMYELATQRHTETWTGTDYANAVTDIQYGYPGAPGGELASVTVLKENGSTPSAVAANTQYNAAGVGTATTLPNTVYSCDAGGRLASAFDSATGITTTYTYQQNTNYISQETLSASPGASVATYNYSYRADGLKTGETDQTLHSDGSTYDTRTLTWSYDGLDRLTQEKSVESAQSVDLNYTDNYSYDLNSNRIKETIENGSGTVTDTITSSYNANDELTQTVDATNGTTTYQYDSNGSQISVTSPTGTTTNVYDLQGRLASVVNKNSSGVVTSSATYEYDESAARIEETTVTGTNSPVTTYFLVDTQTATGYAQVIEQSTTPGTPTVTYVWGVNLISQNNAAGTANAGTYYFIVDAHGSTVALTDANGNVVQTFHYDAFGNALGFTPSSAITQYLYTQQYYDLASSTYYDWARNYNPATGSFTQADYGYAGQPADPMSMLPYTFTGGDPINLSDLNGHAFSLGGVLISTSIMAGLNGILGATLGARNGIWGAVGGFVGGIDSTYISIYGSLILPFATPIAFGVGAAIGAASELGITYGYDYLKTLEARFTICLAGVVGAAIGYVAGEGTVAIAKELEQSILARAGMYQIVENAFRNTSEIEQAGLRNMVVFALEHPLDTIGVFNKAVTGALSEAATDALKAFATNGAVTLTDEVANYLVDEAQKFLQGLNNLAKISQSEAQ